ncbi:hypothetical protein ACX0G7_09770 [Flavitalea antarctica]
MKYLLITILLVPATVCAQITSFTVSIGEVSNGFIYSEGIQWRHDSTGKRIKDIIITGDTMTAIKNLLIYCLEEKHENDQAKGILSHINLSVLQGWFKSPEFNYYVKEYKKAVATSEKRRNPKGKTQIKYHK